MNPTFFQHIEGILHVERIDAYRQDGADPALTLGRYTLNMALSEALYPSLQFAEVALRNAIHKAMTTRCRTDAWYDSTGARLTVWQQDRVTDRFQTNDNSASPRSAFALSARLLVG